MPVARSGHVNSPNNGCLTMHKFSDTGETHKSSLGWGDRLGLDKLYGGVDTEPGPGCGN